MKKKSYEAVNQNRRLRKLLCEFSGLSMKQLRKARRSGGWLVSKKLMGGMQLLSVWQELSQRGQNAKKNTGV